LIANFYLGLLETDDLLKKIFFEAVIRYPREYLLNVIKGIKESFFIETGYYIAIIQKPFSSNPDHPLQINRNDIIRHLSWGYALFSVSPLLLCSYDEPVFLKKGLPFFTSWGESVYIPTILKWAFIFLAMLLASMEYRKDKRSKPTFLYLSMGILAILLFISLSNVIFMFRDKEYQACQHLLSILTGISGSSLAAFGKLSWLEKT
jgi:hypothetical protein